MQTLTPNISPVTNNSDTNRLPWLDFASGIMILWMIVYHALQASWGYEVRNLWGITDASLLPTGVHAFINNEGKLEVLNPCVVFPWLHFFMPWFFYKSGMFFKKRNVRDLWNKDRQKLLRAFVIWSIVGYVFFVIFGWVDSSITLRGATYSILRGLFLNGLVPINGPCWFLLTLFGVRIVANKVLPNSGDKYGWIKIAAIVLAGYVISYLAYRFNHRLLPYWIANGAAGLCFFSLGYVFGDKGPSKYLVGLCIICVFIFSKIGFPIVNMLFNELIAGIGYILWIPVAFCSVVVYNFICSLIYSQIRIEFIELIGKNAMSILVTHCLIYSSIAKVFCIFNLHVSPVIFLLIVLLAYALILPVICILLNAKFVKIPIRKIEYQK